MNSDPSRARWTLQSQCQNRAGISGGYPQLAHRLVFHGRNAADHKESIDLLKELGSQYTPELKGANRAAKVQVETVFGSQAAYAQAMIDDYKAAGISPAIVWAQSFNKDDICTGSRTIRNSAGRRCFWTTPMSGRAAQRSGAEGFANQGIRIVAPADVGAADAGCPGQDRASQYARDAKAAGLDIITWTLERSGRIVEEVLPTRARPAPRSYYQLRLTPSTTMATY